MTTGYLIPFPDRLMPVCRECAVLFGWFYIWKYQGVVEVTHDGPNNRAEHACSKCSRPFRGGQP